MTAGLALIKNVLTTFTTNVLNVLVLKAVASITDAAI